MLFSIYDAWHNIAALSRWRIDLLASPTHWIFGTGCGRLALDMRLEPIRAAGGLCLSAG